MRTSTRRTLVTATTGIIGIGLAVFGIKQCNDKKEMEFERDVANDKATVVEDRREQNIALQDSLQQSRSAVDSLTKVVAVRDDEVLQLRDALELVKKDLSDCEGNKKVAKSTTAKKKTAGKKTAKKAQAKAICNTPVATMPGGTKVSATIVQVPQGCDQPVVVCDEAADKVPVCDKQPEVVVKAEQVKATSPANANAVNATVGNHSNNNNINININNGTINNYYAPVDTVKKKIVYYRVRGCYTRSK